jgi:hypothetical protein
MRAIIAASTGSAAGALLADWANAGREKGVRRASVAVPVRARREAAYRAARRRDQGARPGDTYFIGDNLSSMRGKFDAGRVESS